MTNGDITGPTFPKGSHLTVSEPAIYYIRVAGYLDNNWSDQLGGLKISSTSQEGTSAITTLSGSVIDQAALFGILNALYDMRLPLLSVECIECS